MDVERFLQRVATARPRTHEERLAARQAGEPPFRCPDALNPASLVSTILLLAMAGVVYDSIHRSYLRSDLLYGTLLFYSMTAGPALAWSIPALVAAGPPPLRLGLLGRRLSLPLMGMFACGFAEGTLANRLQSFEPLGILAMQAIYVGLMAVAGVVVLLIPRARMLGLFFLLTIPVLCAGCVAATALHAR
jgi:hypothetical protein